VSNGEPWDGSIRMHFQGVRRRGVPRRDPRGTDWLPSRFERQWLLGRGVPSKTLLLRNRWSQRNDYIRAATR